MPMTLQEMRDIDIRTVKLDTLVEYRDVQVNTSLPKEDQIADYFRQIKNPYCFKLGKAAIKVSFSDTDASLEDCLERFLLSL